MSYHDPISDMLIRIKNAGRAQKEAVLVSYSKFKHEIARALERSGSLAVVERKGKKFRKVLEIKLLLRGKISAVHDLKLITTPSQRVYRGYQKLGFSRHGGVILVSTSQGVMTDAEARKAKVGGQLIAEIW